MGSWRCVNIYPPKYVFSEPDYEELGTMAFQEDKKKKEKKGEVVLECGCS